MSDSKLFASANWVMMLGIVGVLIASQWKHEAIPAFVLAIILVMTVAKVRLIVLDFMDLRHARPTLARALMLWPTFFAIAALAKAVAAPVLH